MNKLVVCIKPSPSVLSISDNTKKVIVNVGKTPAGDKGDKGDKGDDGADASSITTISKLPDNIISKKDDGMYASVNKPSDILSFITALDSAIN